MAAERSVKPVTRPMTSTTSATAPATIRLWFLWPVSQVAASPATCWNWSGSFMSLRVISGVFDMVPLRAAVAAKLRKSRDNLGSGPAAVKRKPAPLDSLAAGRGGRLRRFRSRKTRRIGTWSPKASRSRFSTNRR